MEKEKGGEFFSKVAENFSKVAEFFQNSAPFLHQPVDGQGSVLAVGKASDDAAEVATLVGDADVDVRNLVVVEDLGGLGGEGVANLGAVEEHDVVLDAEGEAATTVHDSSQGYVGQGEVGTALTDATGIEVVGGDEELGAGIAGTHLGEDAAVGGGEAVVLGKVIFKSHCFLMFCGRPDTCQRESRRCQGGTRR